MTIARGGKKLLQTSDSIVRFYPKTHTSFGSAKTVSRILPQLLLSPFSIKQHLLPLPQHLLLNKTNRALVHDPHVTARCNPNAAQQNQPQEHRMEDPGLPGQHRQNARQVRRKGMPNHIQHSIREKIPILLLQLPPRFFGGPAEEKMHKPETSTDQFPATYHSFEPLPDCFPQFLSRLRKGHCASDNMTVHPT